MQCETRDGSVRRSTFVPTISLRVKRIISSFILAVKAVESSCCIANIASTDAYPQGTLHRLEMNMKHMLTIDGNEAVANVAFAFEVIAIYPITFLRHGGMGG